MDTTISNSNGFQKIPQQKTKRGKFDKTIEFVNYLIDNPKGVTYEDMAKATETEVKHIYSTKKRAKFRFPQYKYIIHDGLIKIEHNKGRNPITYNVKKKNKELKDNLIDLLYKNKQGITASEIAIALEIDNKKVFNTIHNMKRYQPIISKNGKYYIEEEKVIKEQKQVLLTANQHKPSNQIPQNYQLLPKTYMDILKDLSPEDKRDILDMLKKSYYYKKSAMALIEAAKLSNNLLEKKFDL